MAITMFIACILLLLSLLYLFLSPAEKSRQNLPPGPFNFPIIGNLLHFGELPHRSLHKLSQKHGPLIYLKLGTIPTVVASSAEFAKEFLKTHDLECCSRPLLTPTNKLSHGSRDVAFAPYGDQWRDLRKICVLNLFSPKKVALFRPIREEEVERMISSISSKQNLEINLSEELMLLANNITCRTALGKRYYNGEGATRILKETQALFMGFFFADYVPILGWLDKFTGMRERLERNFRELDGFFQTVMDEHLDRMMRGDKGDEDAVDALLDLRRKGRDVSDEHIKGVLMDIYVAGSDTSSATLDWTMTELMRNPKVMRKAQNEVRNLIGNKAKVEENDLNQLCYIKATVKESMRLHSPVPLLVQRETMQHFQVNGYDIPPKTRLLINTWTIGRDKNIWRNPEEFYPERFIDSPIDFRGQHFELIPFGAGRRICPGLNSGMLVVELALANLLYLFDWELPEGIAKEEIDMSESPGVTVHRQTALSLRASKFSRM